MHAVSADEISILTSCSIEPRTIEQISQETRFTCAKLHALLVILELKGLLKSTNGQKYPGFDNPQRTYLRLM